jgi:hypothetical protein
MFDLSWGAFAIELDTVNIKLGFTGTKVELGGVDVSKTHIDLKKAISNMRNKGIELEDATDVHAAAGPNGE